jgi:hypothetical protein
MAISHRLPERTSTTPARMVSLWLQVTVGLSDLCSMVKCWPVMAHGYKFFLLDTGGALPVCSTNIFIAYSNRSAKR